MVTHIGKVCIHVNVRTSSSECQLVNGLCAPGLVLLLVESLEHVRLVALGELDTILQQLDKRGGKVLKEGVLVVGILLDKAQKLVVLHQGHVGGQHHPALVVVVLLVAGLVGLKLASSVRLAG